MRQRWTPGRTSRGAEELCRHRMVRDSRSITIVVAKDAAVHTGSDIRRCRGALRTQHTAHHCCWLQLNNNSGQTVLSYNDAYADPSYCRSSSCRDLGYLCNYDLLLKMHCAIGAKRWDPESLSYMILIVRLLSRYTRLPCTKGVSAQSEACCVRHPRLPTSCSGQSASS